MVWSLSNFFLFLQSSTSVVMTWSGRGPEEYKGTKGTKGTYYEFVYLINVIEICAITFARRYKYTKKYKCFLFGTLSHHLNFSNTTLFNALNRWHVTWSAINDIPLKYDTLMNKIYFKGLSGKLQLHLFNYRCLQVDRMTSSKVRIFKIVNFRW